MRKALNDNPVAQIAVLAVLAVVVVFMLLTRMGGSSASTSSSPATTATPVAGATAPDSTAPDSGTTPAPVAPSPDPAAAGGAPANDFAPGPGLPAPVVTAYKGGQTVVVLVTKHAGFDDRVLRTTVKHLRGRADVAVFTTSAKHIADYARVTEGLDVDRAPALVVMRPERLTPAGSMPQASVSYGFRGADSVDQAIRDAQYKGRTDLPFYP
jgi:hypothetical protein